MKKLLIFCLLLLTLNSISAATYNTVIYDSSTRKLVPTSLRNSQVDLGNTTNILLSWNTNYYRATPSNDFSISWTNVPSSSSTYASIVLEIVNTNSTVAYFPTNGPNFTTPFMSAAPSTNWFTMRYNGVTFWIDSHQEIYQNLTTINIATNSTINSNLTVNLEIPSETWYLTNNISITNVTGLQAGTSKTKVIYIKPQLVNRTVVYPTLGGPSFATYFYTNVNSPIWSTLTNSITYILTLDAEGTNVYTTISEWK